MFLQASLLRDPNIGVAEVPVQNKKIWVVVKCVILVEAKVRSCILLCKACGYKKCS